MARPRTTPDPPKKPLKDMTPEERRALNALHSRNRRARLKEGISLTAPVPAIKRSPKGVATLAKEGAAADVYGKKNIYVSVKVQKRIQNALAAMAGAPLYLTETQLYEMGVDLLIDTLEEQYNDGLPFEEPTGDEPRLRRQSVKK